MSQPWWVEAVGERSRAKRLDASEVRQHLDRVLSHYHSIKEGKRVEVVSPMVTEDRWEKARCPFHKDSRASASLNWGKSRFRCHACDIGGDAIDIVMEQENLQFREAMEWIENL